MPRWKKGKTFTKNGRKVRYIYPNGRKSGKKLVSARRGSFQWKRYGKKSYHVRRRRY